MRGRVLDVGGRKISKRGMFRPPLESVTSWEYLNPDFASAPDYAGTAEKIPLPDESMDTIVMSEVLEYVDDFAKAMAEINRVLKPGGFFLLSIPLVTAIHGDAEWDRQRFTRTRLEEISGRSGFEVVEVEEMGSLGAVLHDLLQAYLGYASNNSANLPFRVARRLLALGMPLFRLLDARSGRQRRWINTGYFIVMRKS